MLTKLEAEFVLRVLSHCEYHNGRVAVCGDILNPEDDRRRLAILAKLDTNTPYEYDALKQLLLAIGYGGSISPQKEWPNHVIALALMMNELREENRRVNRERDAVKAELALRDAAPSPEPPMCSMAARIDCGHGRDGYCSITKKPCPRACLLKNIERSQAKIEADKRDAKIGHDMLVEREQRIQMLADENLALTNALVEAKRK